MSTHLVAWAVVQRPDGAVLLARRSGVRYGSGLWGLPGGHVDHGESLAAAAARELHEEVGLRVAVGSLEPLGVTRYVDGDVRGCDFFFRAAMWAGEPTPVAECSQVGWFAVQDLPADSLPWLAASLSEHLAAGTWFRDVR